ncbi:MAG: hypothetical protein QXZ31_07075 [Thermofilaceae archaeon]
MSERGVDAYVLHGRLAGVWRSALKVDFAPPVQRLPPLKYFHVVGTPRRVAGRGVLETTLTASVSVEGEFKVWRWLDDLSTRLLEAGTYVVDLVEAGEVADLLALARLNRHCTFIVDVDFNADPRVGYILVNAALNRPNIDYRNPALLSLRRRLIGLPPVAEELGTVIVGEWVLLQACPHMARAMSGSGVEVTVTPTGYLNCMPPENDPYVWLLERAHEPWRRVEYTPVMRRITE